MVLTQLGMKSNWVWMPEMGYLFHAASSLCHTSSTVLAGKGKFFGHGHSVVEDQRVSCGNRSRDHPGQGNS
ncbi:hypothetical protein TNCV_70031 [Trichonephila clavipes]|nr:hypothetical protein TNCV_70031 [Trichonephila clavipes]